jgi:hypothetical protein
MTQADDWVLLAYRIPREPSTARVAIWRKLKQLGVVQIGDGLVGLPATPRTQESLEWIAEDIVSHAGEATIWLSRPGTRAQGRALAALLSEERAVEYQAIAADARSAIEDEPSAPRTLARLRRELRRVGERDHFSPPARTEAIKAVDQLAGLIDGAREEASR